jgi:hypothetical protein
MNTILRHSKPETEWIKGLPLGNGRIGMMAYGEPAPIFNLLTVV